MSTAKPIPIPLIGTYNTRFAESAVAPTSSGVVGIGIVGVMVVGSTTAASDKDQRFINCWPVTVKNSATQTITPYMVKRPGFQAFSTPASGNVGNDIHIWLGNSSKVMSAFGSTNSTLYDGTTSQGSITGQCTGISETILSGTAYLALSSSDNTAWYLPAGGALTKISDADYPGNAGRTVTGTFAHMDGYAFIMDTSGRIYNSDLNSISSWTANNYASCNLFPDNGVAVIKHRNNIIGFGTESMEVWFNAGNPAGSPLSRRDEACRRIGLINANALTQLEDLVAFVGTSELGGLALYILDGFTPNRVSTPEIEAQLILATTSNISLSACKIMGRTFVVCIVGSATYVYCVEEGLWHEWNSTIPLWQKMAGTAIGSSFVTYAVSTLKSAGKVYILNPSNFVFTDDSDAYTAVIQTALLDFNTSDRKFMDEVTIVGDVATSTSDLTISYSDDDYQTFTVWGTVDLSSSAKRRLSRGGAFRRRAMKLSHSANTSMRLQRMDIKLRGGTA